ncbi:hypothetical protein [Stetteria hydrogenophila]
MRSVWGKPGQYNGVNEADISSRLSRIYEDDDIVVYTAPNEDELKELLLDLLRKHGPMTIRDLHALLSGLASEDKIRQALNHLALNNKVYVFDDGRYAIAEVSDVGYDYYSDYESYDYDEFNEE